MGSTDARQTASSPMRSAALIAFLRKAGRLTADAREGRDSLWLPGLWADAEPPSDTTGRAILDPAPE